MLKFGNKEFRNIQEQVEKNAKDIEEIKEQGVPGGGSGDSGLPTDKPTDNGQILIGYTDGSVEWSTETLREFQRELVSGSNIKTINGESILGSGNIEISGGGTVSVDNVVEFDNISSLPTSPTAVDSATMEKLKNPGTIIKYGREVYTYNSYNSNDNTIHYLNVYNIVNSSSGELNLTFRSLYVITETSTYYPNTGVFSRFETAFNIPQRIGSSYTEDGDYIWIANKSGTSKTGSWQKYTPGTGGGGSGDLSNYYTKSQADNQFAAKTTFDTTVMGINSVLEDIPNTYATNAGVAGLEARVMGELENTNGRIESIENSEPLSGFPTQDFYIDSSGNYTKITNFTMGADILQLDVVNLLTPDWNPDYATIYTFFKDQILRATRGGGRGRIFVEPGWNAFGDSGTNGNKLWLLCVNSGLEVGTFNEPLPKAFIVEYVNSVLTLEMILKNGTRAIMVINEDNGAYSSNGFQEIVYGGGSSGGGITTQDPVTADGQILIGNLDGTYNWTTETFYELTSRISALEAVVNNITYYEGEIE